VHEQYVDQTALDFHSHSAHGAHYFPRMRALFDKIDVEYFDGVIG
jgi:quinol monooxygenase YgiN